MVNLQGFTQDFKHGWNLNKLLMKRTCINILPTRGSGGMLSYKISSKMNALNLGHSGGIFFTHFEVLHRTEGGDAWTKPLMWRPWVIKLPLGGSRGMLPFQKAKNECCEIESGVFWRYFFTHISKHHIHRNFRLRKGYLIVFNSD